MYFQNNTVYRGDTALYEIILSITVTVSVVFSCNSRALKVWQNYMQGWPFFLVYSLTVSKIRVYTHLSLSKCVQNNTVYRGDIPLQNNIVNYCKYTCSFPIVGLQSWQNYHEVSSLPKSLYSSPCLSSFYFLLSQFVALVTQHQHNIMVSVPFICR